jgi:arylsulfatase A-like enzyme/lysophospholipase L1-like esterase
MSRLRLCAVALCALIGSPTFAADSPAGKRPNIVFLITDDQGYGDISAHGNPVLKTPNLDRLHDEGVRFTDFHVSPTCSPTRSSLMSGKHEFKNGVTHTILERERMSLQTITLPQVLKSAGYTTGIFGKWHLGDEAEYQPNRRGFDEVFIHGGGGIGQTYPGSCGDAPGNKYFDPAILHNGKFEKTKGYCTDVFFGQAEQWIDQVRGKQPFFCYIATNAPHGPYIARDEDFAKYDGKTPSEQSAKFLGMVSNIDDNVGRLLAKLKEWNLENDTLFCFMNDNGGTAGVPVFNAGMHGQKGTPYRGGTRASSFWRWPGTLQPGDCDRVCAHIDIYLTLAELAGARLPAAAQQQVEGRSLVPLLVDRQAAWPDRFLFTHVGRWPKGADPQPYKFSNCSVRYGRYNLVNAGGKLGDRVEKNWKLYDLQTDPGEQTDVAAEHADVVQKMTRAYDAWWDEVVPLTRENDLAPGPAMNPFHEWYWKQFGGGPPEPKGKPAGKKTAGNKSARAKSPATVVAQAGAASGPKPAAKKEPDPAMAPIVDDPQLPRVLLIGDSISIGYTLDVRKRLAGKANVHRIPTNGGPTTNGLANLQAWLGTGRWDVIHFNWGLHDIKFMDDGRRQVAAEEYEQNLRRLVEQLKTTGAKLVWCSTTPVPEGKLQPLRRSEDVLTYNAISARIMQENNVAIDDLYTFALPRIKEIQRPVNVHFSPEGSAVLAEQVAASIEPLLPRRDVGK